MENKTDCEHSCEDCGTTPAYYSLFKKYLCAVCFKKTLAKLLATLIILGIIYLSIS